MALPTMGAKPPHFEELKVGGGYASSPDGGAEIDNAGNAALDGDLRVDGEADIGGDLSAAGDAAITGGLTVGGDGNFDNDCTVENLLYVGGVADVAGSIRCGVTGTAQGVVEVRNSTTVPGCLRLHAANGNSYFLFVDNSGKVRIQAFPGPTHESDGTIVGTQS